MNWNTSGAICGKNTYEYMENGKATFEEKGFKNTYIIKDGDIEEIIKVSQKGTKEDRWGGKEKIEHNIKTHLKYEHFYKKWEEGKLVYFDKYDIRKQSRHGECFDKTIIFQGLPGNLITKWYRGSRMMEKFVYQNGVTAFQLKDKSKELIVYHPNKKLWMEFKKSSSSESKKYLFRTKGWHVGLINFIDNFLKENWNELGVVRVLDDRNYTTKIYDEQGKITHQGEVKEGQLVGEWLWKGEVRFLLQGVLVNERIFKTPPEQLDPNEVLKLENVQLRSALFSKIGYEKVVQKCNGKVIHKDGDMELISIPIVKGKINRAWNNEGDTNLVILKVKCPSTGVFYTLRVPPEMTECEQARQWTFGLNTRPTIDSETGKITPAPIQPENYYEFVQET